MAIQGPGTVHNIQTASVDAREKVRLCPSVISIFVLSVGKQNGPGKCGTECSNHVNRVEQLLDILFIGYTQ